RQVIGRAAALDLLVNQIQRVRVFAADPVQLQQGLGGRVEIREVGAGFLQALLRRVQLALVEQGGGLQRGQFQFVNDGHLGEVLWNRVDLAQRLVQPPSVNVGLGQADSGANLARADLRDTA